MTKAEAIQWLETIDALGIDDGAGSIVIALKMAVEALKAQKWMPITSRPMDEEEREEWSDRLGYELDDEEAVMYCSPLPDYGQEVLVCSKNGYIAMDTFYQDECGCYFENNGDMDGIIAWMPLPKRWEGEPE